MKNLYQWQVEVLKIIKEKDAIISAPTGSGKTLVAYYWANLFKEILDGRRIIFTAPIKALSNERWKELDRLFPQKVGIETGDIKKNVNAPILCCTQEIYTLKYSKCKNQYVIIDEFHYITQNEDRARAYFEGIANSDPSNKLLVMSATFGNPQKVKKYLDRISGRDFILYNTDFRPTKQEFIMEELTFEDIIQRKSIVFLFSYSGVENFADDLANEKDMISSHVYDKISQIAECHKVNINKFPTLIKGVGIYHGSLLPKEKLFMEEIFRRGYIDQIVGTDALSLGVNLPAKLVCFGQLARYHSGPISKNEFLQMSGRAGRKGFYDVGLIGYIETPYENFQYSTSSLYYELLNREPENFEVRIGIDWKNILLKKSSVEKEAKVISIMSEPKIDYDTVLSDIEYDYREIINFLVENNYSENELGEVYFNEFGPDQNIGLFKSLKVKEEIGDKFTIDSFIPNSFEYADGRTLFYLLQILRWYRSLPKKYQDLFEKGFEEKMIDYIKQIDHTTI